MNGSSGIKEGINKTRLVFFVDVRRLTASVMTAGFYCHRGASAPDKCQFFGLVNNIEVFQIDESAKRFVIQL